MRPSTTFLLLSALLLVLAITVDQWVYQHVSYPLIYNTDLGRLLRVMGFLPTWAFAATALYLQEQRLVPDARRRALLLIGSPLVAGLVAEVLKLTFRRERPSVAAGLYSWRPFTERPFSTSGLALPSSHTMVAFGAVWMLCRMFPRAKWVWIALGVGCGASRVAAQAHFVSDVVAAALASFATTAWLWRRYGNEMRVSGERTTMSGLAVDQRDLLP